MWYSVLDTPAPTLWYETSSVDEEIADKLKQFEYSNRDVLPFARVLVVRRLWREFEAVKIREPRRDEFVIKKKERRTASRDRVLGGMERIRRRTKDKAQSEMALNRKKKERSHGTYSNCFSFAKRVKTEKTLLGVNRPSIFIKSFVSEKIFFLHVTYDSVPTTLVVLRSKQAAKSLGVREAKGKAMEYIGKLATAPANHDERDSWDSFGRASLIGIGYWNQHSFLW
jgi:hypothetical protein